MKRIVHVLVACLAVLLTFQLQSFAADLKLNPEALRTLNSSGGYWQPISGGELFVSSQGSFSGNDILNCLNQYESAQITDSQDGCLFQTEQIEIALWSNEWAKEFENSVLNSGESYSEVIKGVQNHVFNSGDIF